MAEKQPIEIQVGEDVRQLINLKNKEIEELRARVKSHQEVMAMQGEQLVRADTLLKTLLQGLHDYGLFLNNQALNEENGVPFATNEALKRFNRLADWFGKEIEPFIKGEDANEGKKSK